MPYPASYDPYFVEVEDPETYYMDMQFQDKPNPPYVDKWIFTARDAEAHWAPAENSFFVKKAKRPGDEIDIRKLHPELQKRWTDPGGAREKEWKKINVEGATKVWRGKEAAELRRKYADRIIRSRWHEKWKDMGDEYENGIDLNRHPEIRACEEAKSRWILLGFEDPDITNLNRTFPLPPPRMCLWHYN